MFSLCAHQNVISPKWEENVELPFWIKLSLRIGLIFFFFLIFFLSSISSKLSPVQPNLIWLFVSFILDKIVPCETVFFLFFFFSLVCVHLLFFFFSIFFNIYLGFFFKSSFYFPSFVLVSYTF